MRPLRNHLVAAGIPVENSKGEAEAGQEELNIRYASALNCAEFHTIAKHATKGNRLAAGSGQPRSCPNGITTGSGRPPMSINRFGPWMGTAPVL